VSSGRRWRPAHGRSRTGRRSGGLAGHEAIAVDLPGDDPSAGLPEYADLVTSAIGDRGNLVLVAMSLGGFTAPLVAAKVPVDALVFVNAMIPSPGETPGAWWDNTGWAEARIAAAGQGGYSAEFDLAVWPAISSASDPEPSDAPSDAFPRRPAPPRTARTATPRCDPAVGSA
jgi:hypothetical protein